VRLSSKDASRTSDCAPQMLTAYPQLWSTLRTACRRGGLPLKSSVKPNPYRRTRKNLSETASSLSSLLPCLKCAFSLFPPSKRFSHTISPRSGLISSTSRYNCSMLERSRRCSRESSAYWLSVRFTDSSQGRTGQISTESWHCHSRSCSTSETRLQMSQVWRLAKYCEPS
jgi:hypothetical protein